MDSGVRKFHPVSDSESESASITSNKKSKASGLLPRKDNHRACKGKRTNTNVSTSSTCSKSVPSPVIDNSSRPSIGDEEEEEIAQSGVSPTVPHSQNLSQTQLDTMNEKLNTLIEFVNRTNAHMDDSEEGQISENEENIEDEEDSSLYFHSITEKNTIQGPTINEPLALGVTNILKSGLNTTSIDSFKDIYVCPENCKRMEVVVVNPEILNSASTQTKKQDTASKVIQTEIMRGLMASCAAYTQVVNVSQQDTISKKDVRRILRPMADAISLQAHTSHFIDVERRLNFKKDIKEEFASLCTNSYPVENMLFGQELQEKIKSVDHVKINMSLPRNNS